MSDTRDDLPAELEEEVPPVGAGPIEPEPIPTDEPILPVDPNFVRDAEAEPLDDDDV